MHTCILPAVLSRHAKRSLTVIALMTAVLCCHASQDPDAIRLGQVSLSFYAVTGGIVQHVLESEGHTVEVIPGSHAEIYPKVGSGEVDILAASWLPGAHAALYAKVKDTTFELAVLYDDARLYWSVPAYIPDTAISSIDDLKKTDVLDKIDRQIISLPEATGLTTLGRRVLGAYGLDRAGYSIKAAPAKVWLGNFKAAVNAGKWIVMPLWQPQWINAAYDVRILDEPKGIYGRDSAVLLAHEGLKRKLSERALTHLGNIRLSVEAVTEMDRLVNIEGLQPLEAARRWIARHATETAAWRP
jgi:glycine betaine/proline transport system substrate-binding protein